MSSNPVKLPKGLMLPTKGAPPIHNPLTWTIHEVVEVLGKLPELDLKRFLMFQFPDQFTEITLAGLDRGDLSKLIFSLLQRWEQASGTQAGGHGDAFLLEVTSALCRASFEAFVRLLWEEVPVAQPIVWNWHMGVFCSEIQLCAEELIAGRGRPHDFVCNVPPGTSKPVWEEMDVLMGDGTYRPLKDIKEGDYVIGKSGTPCRVSAVHIQGNLPCVGIKTFLGRKIIAAHDHPILTAGGWVNAGNIIPGDHLALLHKQQIPVGTDRHIDEFRLAGYFIGDGSVGGNSCSLTGKDPDYLEDFSACAKRLGHGCTVRVRKNGITWISLTRIGKTGRLPENKGRWKGMGRGRRCLSGPRAWLREIGLSGKLSWNKEIPEFVWKGTNEQIAAFLAAYFHCDGCISRRENGFFRASFSTISPKLAYDIQRIMLRLGIRMAVRKRVSQAGWGNVRGPYKRGYNKGKTEYTHYSVGTASEDDASKFLERIPILGYKHERLTNLPPKRRVFEQQYLPDEVKEVEDIGELPCRCLSVDEDNSFVVEGVVVHNTTIWSVLFPCWMWTRMPKCRFITASHTEKLAVDSATYAREVMGGKMYTLLFPEIDFTGVQDAKDYYRNSLGGDRFTCTVAGKSPTGRHGSCIIVDDPIDPKKVLSEAERKTAADFMTQVIPSRRIRTAQGDQCITMLVMQRLGVGDPTDVMLEVAKRPGAAALRYICLPAETCDNISPPEFKRFYEGWNADAGAVTNNLLDPIRLSRKMLDEQRAILGEWSYAGQFLQKPRPPGGGMFKSRYLHFWPAAPFSAKRIRYWDRAASTSEGACYTAGVLMAYDGERIYVEDVRHGRWDPDDRNEVMLDTARKDRLKYGKYEPVIYVEAEMGSSGRDAWLGIVRKLIGFHVREDIVRGSKDTRAEPWSTQWSAGNVYVVDNGASSNTGIAGWDITGYLEEHENFRPAPGKRISGYADRVDASSGAFNLLVGLKRMYTALRTIPIKAKKDHSRYILVTTVEDLPAIEVDDKHTLVILLTEPLAQSLAQPTIIDATEVGQIIEQQKKAPLEPIPREPVPMELPLHRLQKNQGVLQLCFADINPADYQGPEYDKPIAPWNAHVQQLQLSRDQGKQLWSFILKKWEKPWQVLLVVDTNDNSSRALSTAYAISDCLSIPRSAIHVWGSDGEVCTKEDEIPNSWVYDQTRLAKSLVVA